MSFWLRNSTDSDDSNPWIITTHVGLEGAITNDTMLSQTTGATPNLLWNLWWNGASGAAGTGGLRGALPIGVHWYFCETQWRLAAGQGDATGVAEYAPPTSTAGLRSGTAAPQPMCVVVRKNVASGIKKHRGRNYLPALGGDFQYDGQVVQATKTAIAAAYNALLSNTLFATSYPLIVAGSDGVNRLVSSYDVANLAGVQRRRLR